MVVVVVEEEEEEEEEEESLEVERRSIYRLVSANSRS